ncbi:hypothetical protein N9N67_09900 [Bacteriovoracaceae bacterium]|nr:hypothetical protein [Bacteriovoracaceae bacterium]
MDIGSLLEEHLEKMASHYTQGDCLPLMKQAKDEYFKITGVVNEDDPEYEARINCFLDWYFFNFTDEEGLRVIDRYIKDFEIDNKVALSFLNVNYSLFHFVKYSWRKKIVLKDILHSLRITLNLEGNHLGLVEGDLFIGRIFNYNDENFLLNGLCVIPNDVIGILAKESKKIRKLKNFNQETNFLLQLESMKTRSIQYGHINPDKIFSF